MSEAIAKPITGSVYRRAYTSYRPHLVPRPRPTTPVEKEPGTWIEIPPRRRKLTEAKALAAWDALPETVSCRLPEAVYEPVSPQGAYARSRKPMRIIRRENFDPRRHTGDPQSMLETNETWMTLWPAHWLRLGAPRP